MKKLAREVCIIGVGMHNFGKFLDRNLKELTRVAVWNAIHDAGIDAERIEAAYFANVLAGLIAGQEAIRGRSGDVTPYTHGSPLHRTVAAM